MKTLDQGTDPCCDLLEMAGWRNRGDRPALDAAGELGWGLDLGSNPLCGRRTWWGVGRRLTVELLAGRTVADGSAEGRTVMGCHGSSIGWLVEEDGAPSYEKKKKKKSVGLL
ncbi:hypothetical protein ACLOJK_007499 [Asimina triloba]